MKNKKLSTLFSLVIIGLSISPAYALPPKAPDINVSTVGKQVIVNFDPVSGADGYRLYYAEFPSLSLMQSIDLGNSTLFKVTLDETHYFASAIKAYNSDGESGYSNIEFASLNEDLTWR